jgi:hypothetical protein
MRRAAFVITGLGLSIAGGAACAPRSVETASPGQVTTTRAVSRTASDVLASWPEKQRETANMLIGKYGQPTVIGDRMIAWFNTGPFVQTVIMRDGQPHNFPMAHVDYLTQTIKHAVPANKLAELYQYDGSVWFHRTRGELSAQCDVEAMNFLALNLAHDIITGKRSVSDARAFYARTAMSFKQGDRSSPYVTGLMFPTEPNAPDPDRVHQM